MANFYTSDLHIGHAKVAEIRGFATTEIRDTGPTIEPVVVVDVAAHADYIAEIWDSTVKKDDTVYVLGDTGLGQFEKVVLPWFKDRPGIKHLIAGNHDPVHPCRSDAVKLQPKWLDVFRTINPYLTRKVAGEKFMLSHFPYESYGDGTTHGEEGGRWNEWRVPEELGKPLVHGHTHGPEREHDNMFHVGWDAWNELVPEERILEWLQGLNQ